MRSIPIIYLPNEAHLFSPLISSKSNQGNIAKLRLAAYRSSWGWALFSFLPTHLPPQQIPSFQPVKSYFIFYQSPPHKLCLAWHCSAPACFSHRGESLKPVNPTSLQGWIYFKSVYFFPQPGSNCFPPNFFPKHALSPFWHFLWP